MQKQSNPTEQKGNETDHTEHRTVEVRKRVAARNDNDNAGEYAYSKTLAHPPTLTDTHTHTHLIVADLRK